MPTISSNRLNKNCLKLKASLDSFYWASDITIKLFCITIQSLYLGQSFFLRAKILVDENYYRLVLLDFSTHNYDRSPLCWSTSIHFWNDFDNQTDQEKQGCSGIRRKSKTKIFMMSLFELNFLVLKYMY